MAHGALSEINYFLADWYKVPIFGQGTGRLLSISDVRDEKSLQQEKLRHIDEQIVEAIKKDRLLKEWAKSLEALRDVVPSAADLLLNRRSPAEIALHDLLVLSDTEVLLLIDGLGDPHLQKLFLDWHIFRDANFTLLKELESLERAKSACRQQIRLLNRLIGILIRLVQVPRVLKSLISSEMRFFQYHGTGRPPSAVASLRPVLGY